MNKNCLFVFLIFTSFIIFHYFDSNGKQTGSSDTTSIVLSENKYAVEAYDRGVEYLMDGNIDDAVMEFKSAIKLDKKFAEAHHQLGLSYLERNTIYWRSRSVLTLKEAVFWDRDDFKIQLDLGKAYLKQRFRYNAKKKFEWLQKTNPNNVELLLSLGKLYQEDVEYYENMVDVYADNRGVLSFINSDLLSAIFNYDGIGVVKEFIKDRDELFGQFQDYSSYLEKDFANAAIAYAKVLDIDSKNKEALNQLSLLSFTAGMMHEFIKYQKMILEIDPNNKNAHLYLGLGYHKIKEYGMAFKEYEIARSLMEPDELTVFNSIDYIIPYDKRKEYEQLAFNAKMDFENKFWKERDPLYLSEYNERILEHYCRVAYSNLKFEVPRKSIPGWKTDRGKIYIRYGQPLRIARLRPSSSNQGIGGDFDLCEIWYYENFSFAFEDPYLTGDFKLGSRTRFPGVNFPEMADVLYKECSEIYAHRYEGTYFDVPFYTANFRSKEKKTQTEVYYAIPKNDLSFSRIDTNDVSSVLKGFFVFDENWNEIQRSVSKEKFYLSTRLNPEKYFYIICQNNLDLPFGNYTLVFELQDEESKNTNAQRKNLIVDSYKMGNLDASDVVLASLIDSTFQKTPFSKHNLQIIPNPSRTYSKSQPVYLYFEVYNLRLAPPGETGFDVIYNVQTAEKEKSTASKVFSKIGKFFGQKDEKVSISSSYFYHGSTPSEKIYLSIDMSALKNDVYDLSVTVVDVNSKERINKNAQLIVQDDLIYYLY